MKIQIEETDGKKISIFFPNWLILNRFGINKLAKSIVQSDKIKLGGESTRKSGHLLTDTDAGAKKTGENGERGGVASAASTDPKAEIKKLKKALNPALRELRVFFKRKPNFVFVEAFEKDGDFIKISF